MYKRICLVEHSYPRKRAGGVSAFLPFKSGFQKFKFLLFDCLSPHVIQCRPKLRIVLLVITD